MCQHRHLTNTKLSSVFPIFRFKPKSWILASALFFGLICSAWAQSSNVSVFASGFNNPRGLKFGPDGNLYVAEGGTGGQNFTDGACDQVVPPIGPYTGNNAGSRISKVNARGLRTTVIDNLPSDQASAAAGSPISGVADVAFIGNTLYALLGGAGCSHGVTSLPNGVIRVHANGTFDLVADLSAFQMAHPVKNPEPDDFEPDGTWYSMVAFQGDLYAVEPNHGELDKITTSGQVSRIIDISASQGHIVPTAMVHNNGAFFVGNLNTFPIVQGSSNIYRITLDGHIKIVVERLTTVLGVAFDQQDRLYVLENTTGKANQFPTPGTGKVVRITDTGDKQVIASGLFLPTAMTFGPDGALYVSNVGFGPPPNGQGQILKITVP